MAGEGLLPSPSMHLYLHVPFCARRCSYCDFSIAVRKVTPWRAFVATIRGEWEMRRREWGGAGPLRTLYFGGGTPSRLDPRGIAELITLFREEQGMIAGAEVTLEANPDDVTPARAAAWAAAGVTRVSLGVQSHDGEVLTWMHRTHTASQVPVAVGTLREAGLTDISLDLIFALPAALQRDWHADLDRTLALEPTHISLYGLTVESRTPLARWVERGEVTPAPDDRYAEEYLAAHQALTAHGYEHYEVSNAGRPGFHARHNATYWSGGPYLGLGPSAHSFQNGVRSWNITAWSSYQEAVTAGTLPLLGSEELNESATRLEACYLGLRTSGGLPRQALPERVTAPWLQAGWAQVADDRIRLTAEGWLRLDALVASAGDSYLSEYDGR